MGSLPTIPWSANDGLGFTLSVDALACVLLIVLFLIVRNLRGDVQRTPERADIFGRLRRTSQDFMSASASFSTVASRLLKHEPEDAEIFGVGGQNYLSMLWHLAWLFAIFSVFSILCIWPVEIGLIDVSSRDPFKHLRERLSNETIISSDNISASAKKLQEGSTNMWILCGVSWLYSLAALWVVNGLVTAMRKPVRTDINNNKGGLTTASQMFTVLVQQLPPGVDHRFNATLLKEVLHKEFGEIIAVNIVPQMETLSDLYERLVRCTDRLKYLQELEVRQFEGEFVNGEWRANTKMAKLPSALAWHIPSRRWWFPPKQGGLEFLLRAYGEERQNLEEAIAKAESEDITSTSCAFATFCNVASVLSADGVRHIRYKDEWRGTAFDEVLATCTGDFFKPRHIKLVAAPLAHDINWENIAVGGVSRVFRTIFAVSALIIVMIVLVTPVSMANIVVPIVLNIQSDFKILMEKQTSHLPAGEVANMIRNINGSYNHVFTAFFTQYFPMVALIFINSVILPITIQQVANFQAYSRKEFKEQSTLMMNYSFMVLNLLIIPLLGLDSINALMLYAFERVRMSIGKTVVVQLEELAEMLGIVLLSSSATFAMKYFISSIFISSASQLLQAPQAILVWWNSSRSITTKEKDEASERWPFDWGYWYGYNCAFFAVAITFAPSVPIICPLACLHFFIKYYVDRYTLVYGVFEPMFQAEGHVEQLVIRCLYSAIAFMQLVMSGFFAIQSVNDPNFVYASWLHVVLIFVIIYLAVTRTEIKRDLSEFQTMNYKTLYDQYRTPSLDIGELHFREQLPTVYRHPAIEGKPNVKSWGNWQWPSTGQGRGAALRSIREEDDDAEDVAAQRSKTTERRQKVLDSNGPTPSALPDSGNNTSRSGVDSEMQPLLQGSNV